MKSPTPKSARSSGRQWPNGRASNRGVLQLDGLEHRT
jgi:hypothetical protein